MKINQGGLYMSKKDENKSRKRLTLSLGLVASLGILSIVYAVVSSQLNIKSSESKLSNKYQGAVQFVGDNSLAYSAGSSVSVTGVNSGPFYSNSDNADTTGKSNRCDLANVDSPSYVFAKAGTVAISTVNSTNDTATISGTELFDHGAYVVYKLRIKNTSDLPMRLSDYDSAKLSDSISSETTGLKDVIKEVVEVKIYTSDPSTGGGAELSAISAEDAKSVTGNQPNCLQQNGTTDWYVKVSCKEGSDKFAEGTFSFNVSPSWMGYQKS